MTTTAGTAPGAEFGFLDAPVEQAARRLLGCELVSEIDGEYVRVRIVETEAYDETDPASHTFRGRTPRNAAMFLPAGHLYVYRSHGIHFCCNVVTGRAGVGSGVLIRAAEPLEGEEIMRARRGRGGAELTNGPGKLGQALGADLSLTGTSLTGDGRVAARSQRGAVRCRDRHWRAGGDLEGSRRAAPVLRQGERFRVAPSRRTALTAITRASRRSGPRPRPPACASGSAPPPPRRLPC